MPDCAGGVEDHACITPRVCPLQLSSMPLQIASQHACGREGVLFKVTTHTNPPPKTNWAAEFGFADLFCQFVGFLNFADLFCQFVGFRSFCRFVLPTCWGIWESSPNVGPRDGMG